MYVVAFGTKKTQENVDVGQARIQNTGSGSRCRIKGRYRRKWPGLNMGGSGTWDLTGIWKEGNPPEKPPGHSGHIGQLDNN